MMVGSQQLMRFYLRWLWGWYLWFFKVQFNDEMSVFYEWPMHGLKFLWVNLDGKQYCISVGTWKDTDEIMRNTTCVKKSRRLGNTIIVSKWLFSINFSYNSPLLIIERLGALAETQQLYLPLYGVSCQNFTENMSSDRGTILCSFSFLEQLSEFKVNSRIYSTNIA